MVVAKNFYYKDLNDNNPTENPDVLDVEAIVQNVANFTFTNKGERPFLPDFGMDLDSYLFELMDDEASVEVFNNIVSGLRKYEPRVTLDFSLSAVVPDPEENQFLVDLHFVIEGFDGQTFRVTDALTR